METEIRNMISKLRRKVVTDVPECGEFPVVYERIPNPDKRMCLTDIMLKVTKPPKELKGTERERYLELVGYRLPSPYISESVVGFGSKQDILKRLEEEALVEKIMERIPHLDEDLRDAPIPVE